MSLLINDSAEVFNLRFNTELTEQKLCHALGWGTKNQSPVFSMGYLGLIISGQIDRRTIPVSF